MSMCMKLEIVVSILDKARQNAVTLFVKYVEYHDLP